ncbi:MAG: hypothetical protein IJI68_01055 [Eggerthellaceae bacterium]|nr:hypothetical protein [Eggerthellaceae bacterium]
MSKEVYITTNVGDLVPEDIMSTIIDGIKQKHEPVPGGGEFVGAIYALYDQFLQDKFKSEWSRLDENTKIYDGDHWSTFGNDNPDNALLPRPSIPTITSAIENLKADYNDEFPEAVIEKESVHSERLAKILTTVIREELDICGFEQAYNDKVHDVLQDGWGCWEIGYDPDMNEGLGGSYIRYVMNKNFLCDPHVRDIQDGRACFKIDAKPKYWFKQHYPDKFALMSGDDGFKDENHENKTDRTRPSEDRTYMLLECWVRMYNAEEKRHEVHFVKVAGHQLLENSADEYPHGYYAHGMYPFVVTALYPQRGTALGIGLVDMFKDAQRYSDKAMQIILSNLYRAAKPRVLLDRNYVEDIRDALDFSKEVIFMKGNLQNAYAWQQPQPLPNTAFTSVDFLTSTIKNESGTNDQSRGQTGAGVTAASAITALQTASTKRSRMGAQRLQFSFRRAISMLLAVLREKAIVPRKIEITMNGKAETVSFDRKWFSEQMKTSDGTTVVPFISIKSARQTRFNLMAHNELVLQMMQVTQGQTDPVIMLEAFESDNKEAILDTIRKAQREGMLNLQKQNAELAEAVKQLSGELSQYKQAMASAEANMQQMAEQQAQDAQRNLRDQQKAQAQGMQGLNVQNMG